MKDFLKEFKADFEIDEEKKEILCVYDFNDTDEAINFIKRINEVSIEQNIKTIVNSSESVDPEECWYIVDLIIEDCFNIEHYKLKTFITTIDSI